VTTKTHAHPGFALIGNKWYAVYAGEVINLRAVEHATTTGTAQCVHCRRDCHAYCKSCRRPVCGDDFDITHREDHDNRNTGWTQTARQVTV
jgi:hypothetical protein